MQSSDSVVETRLISTDLPTAWMYREQGAHDAPQICATPPEVRQLGIQVNPGNHQQQAFVMLPILLSTVV